MPTKDRQRQLAREKVQRQMARRVAMAHQRRRRQAISGIVIAVLAVGALGVAGAIKVRNAHIRASTATCSYPKSTAGAVPRKAKLPPKTRVSKKGTVQVELTTDQGKLSLTLDRAKAPCTVNSFASLIRQKYFDKTICHRITTQGSFVLQCGDPSGTGSGGPGYAFPDENLPLKSGTTVIYSAGTIAMANSGAGTNGSQFFIVYKDSAFPPSYSVFGRLAAGLPVVEKIAAAGSTPKGDGKPTTPVTITSAKLVG